MPKGTNKTEESTAQYNSQYNCACGYQFFLKGNECSTLRGRKLTIRLHKKVCQQARDNPVINHRRENHIYRRDGNTIVPNPNMPETSTEL